MSDDESFANMSDDEKFEAASSQIPMMSIFRYKARSQFEVFSEARERYLEQVKQIKAKMKDAPLDLLTEVSGEDGNTTKMDPDLIPESKVTISDAARREIHRRAFEGFIMVPFRKAKRDAYGLGYLRKPKY